jgi:hypothetical protein
MLIEVVPHENANTRASQGGRDHADDPRVKEMGMHEVDSVISEPSGEPAGTYRKPEPACSKR